MKHFRCGARQFLKRSVDSLAYIRHVFATISGVADLAALARPNRNDSMNTRLVGDEERAVAKLKQLSIFLEADEATVGLDCGCNGYGMLRLATLTFARKARSHDFVAVSLIGGRARSESKVIEQVPAPADDAPFPRIYLKLV